MADERSKQHDKARVLLLGGGGHARVLLDVLRLRGAQIAGVLDDDAAVAQLLPVGVDRLGSLADLQQLQAGEVVLINAVGSADLPKTRRRIFQDAQQQGFEFTNLMHPSAVIAEAIAFGQGLQLMAGTIVGPGTTLGKNVLLNTKTSVDHDTIIGDHTHLAPGVTVCGEVTIGESCHIGCGATVIQGVTIGDHVMVAAGAVVVSDVPSGSRVAGVPARAM